MTEVPPGFDEAIRPLLRPLDIDTMSFAFDLSAYEEVRENADMILRRLADGSMPCDGPWSEKSVQLFRRWVETGMLP
jgi:hypothetical protein